jgi:hypothetical protein
MAMIYDDETFDPSGQFMGEAELLYEQTKRFVPLDYYQYERLARIYWRRTKAQLLPSIKRELAAKGLENAVFAENYRMKSSPPAVSKTGAVCGTYFNMVLFTVDPDETKRKQYLDAAIQQANLAVDSDAQKDRGRSEIAKDGAKLIREFANTLKDSDAEKKKLLLELAAKLEA